MAVDTLKLPSHMDIEHSQDFKALLVEVLEDCKSINIDSSEVIAADTAGMQLLLAFMHHCEEKGVDVSWDTPNNQLLKIAKLLGMQQLLRLE